MSDTSAKVLQHHSDMITELGGLFATNSKEWRSICAELEMLGHITTYQMGDVKSIHDVFKYLMQNGKIYYGRYDILCGVLDKQNVAATRIFNKYTELIRQENTCNGRENTDESQEVFSQQNGGDKKRKPGPSGDREPKLDSNPRKKKWRKAEEDAPFEFRKQIDNTHDARIIDVWNNARNAVGRIQGPLITGTGIRVGTKYILTAYHVAENITKENKGDAVDWSNLGSKQVWIEFHFPKNGTREKFHFEPELIAGDSNLDFAILELKTGDSKIPKPIIKFGKPDNCQLFALLGHPDKADSNKMQFDSDIKLFDMDADMNSDRRGYMIENDREKRGYEGILDKGKVLFDCWVQHGASGAPGIVMGNDDEEPICTLMLVRGFPKQAFEKDANIPHEQMVEQGVTMEEIANNINKQGNRCKQIKEDIFGKHFPQK